MLSKSKFILGQQCHKSLWLDIQKIKPTNPLDTSTENRLRAGNEVGEEAKKLFPGGVDIPFISGAKGYQKMCALTHEAIESGSTTIYEASFIENNVFIRIDIMNLSQEGWDIYEVKSSTRLHSYHKEDAGLQWHVLDTVSGLRLNKVFVVTLNKSYMKNGDIEPKKLFSLHDLSDFVLTRQADVTDQLNKIKSVAKSNIEPKVNIGSHCSKPHGCKYFDRCWPKNFKDNNSIFRLYQLRLNKKLDLFNGGIDVFEKIKPETMLKPASKYYQIQSNQIKANQILEPIIDKSKLNSFINSVKYPISYFDFEAFSDAVPVFDGQKPHMQMAFQYSLHIQKDSRCKLEENSSHFEFIAPLDEDPRRAIAESMLENFPKGGTIMAFHKTYEMTRIKELANHLPDLASDLLKLNERFIDLKDPFSQGAYYHHGFGGSFSLKKVLPALCPNDDRLDYEKLDINNGLQASGAYQDMRNQTKEEALKTSKKLLEYCRLDTYAMYAIYSKLLEAMD